MKHFQVYKIFALLLSLFICNEIIGQTAGDEDKEMFNRAKERDQHAIDKARSGWWTTSMNTHEQRIQWWREARFGMFIHWGIYSLPGGEWKARRVGGYAEHLMRKEKISRNEYLQIAKQFNPVEFDAEKWILHAKNAGMKYFIMTAKHHDGFALYDSKVSDFSILKQTPFKRDPIGEIAAAARKHGMKFGFYYSHAFDWEHPDAPGNDWEYKNPGGDLLIGGANWYDTHSDWLPKAVKYVDEKAIPQIKELLTKYHPDILWFDTPHKLPLSENIRILEAIRETDPNVVVNGRLVRSAATNFGDYRNTADRPAEFYPVKGDWEAIPTTNESYGYHKFDNSHKPVGHFIRLLANAASRGGNLLMNIGPKGDGAFDQADINILQGIGKWMQQNGESIYGTSASSLPMQNWGVATMKEDVLYLHVFNYPPGGKLYVNGLPAATGSAELLAEPSKNLSITRWNESISVIQLPAKAVDTVNTVVRLKLKSKPVPDSTLFIAPGPAVTRLLAFDAIQHGKGFGFGDGKTNRYYVEGWKSVDQWLSWKVKVAEKEKFSLVIKYLAGGNSAGSFKIMADNVPVGSETTFPASKTNEPFTKKIGTVIFSQGVHVISIKPMQVTGEELMKLLEIQLIPSNNK